MKSLISIASYEFKHHFGEVMEECVRMCIANNQEIIITTPEKKNGPHIEVAKITPVGKGVKCDYSCNCFKEFGINTQNSKLSKIATIMADALEQEKVYTTISPEAEHKLARAMETAAKELIKTFNL